jgi:hypothetical protein
MPMCYFFFLLKLAVLILESVVTSDTAELCAIRAELCAQKGQSHLSSQALRQGHHQPA